MKVQNRTCRSPVERSSPGGKGKHAGNGPTHPERKIELSAGEDSEEEGGGETIAPRSRSTDRYD